MTGACFYCRKYVVLPPMTVPLPTKVYGDGCLTFRGQHPHLIRFNGVNVSKGGEYDPVAARRYCEV